MLNPWLLTNNNTKEESQQEQSEETSKRTSIPEAEVVKDAYSVSQDFEDNFVDFLKQEKEKANENEKLSFFNSQGNLNRRTTANCEKEQEISAETETATSKNNTYQPLSDTELYIETLERKLNKLKKSSKLLAALSEKRADCLRSFLLNDSIATVDSDEYQSKHWNHEDFQLDEQCSRADPDNVVQTLYRHLQPIQAVTIGETVELIKYDQLEQQQRQQEP